MKKFALAALTSEYLSPLVRPLVRGADTILTLHRFAEPGEGVRGQDPEALRADLAYLRKNRYELVGVADVVARFSGEAPPSRASIAFTVDDGYYDWFRVAAPIFAEFDCPVTVFLTTGFVDGELWNWWDHVEHVVMESSRTGFCLSFDDGEWNYLWRSPAEREPVVTALVHRLERTTTARKLEIVEALAAALDVELPSKAPPRYAAMTWDDVRSAARGGATFGPHTVTHPILAQCSDDACRFEIEESWHRVRQESDASIPIFAYPNGQPHAMGEREAALVRRAGMAGAVTTRQRYVERRDPKAEMLAPFLIPRFPYPLDRPHLVQLATGLERAKLMLARAMHADVPLPVAATTTR